jgi:UDP-N-acetyl-D-mannosaminuronic acid dehydrogenase
MSPKKISVIGLGYIGLPTAALLANKGYSVAGADIDPHVVSTVNQGKIHIVEPDLECLVRAAVADGHLKAFSEPQSGDVYVICVPTPLHESKEIPQPNIEYVIAATRSIAPLVKVGDLVILESTSPVGTTEGIRSLLRGEGVQVDGVHIAYCPERVLPGKIMIELVENDRIVGGVTPAATLAVAEFYRTFVSGTVFETDSKTAEMCKLTENSYRDVNIAFANELSMICDKQGIDVRRLIQLANRHPRVSILQPGAGVGGHCIAVDPWFIVAGDIENSRLIRTAREVNSYKTSWVVEKIRTAAADVTAAVGVKPIIACLGLAFKPDIDDLRESPSLHIATSLKTQGYNVIAVEPNISSHAEIECVSLDDALRTADVLVVLVKHSQFLSLEARRLSKAKKILDFCGVVS